jgi:glycosyltransferase involved in cell wall biosynthesis
VTTLLSDGLRFPTVSVVIPMYNARAWIRETLESVHAQTYPGTRLELIVLDDGSSDDCASIARAFLAERTLRGEVIARDGNTGVGAARNAGWKRATGEWIQFLDADDLLAPRKIEVQAGHASRAPADVAVVYSPWQHLGLRDGCWQPSGPVWSSSIDDDTVVRILEDFHFGYVGPVLIRRDALEAVAGFDEHLSLGEDLDLMLRIAMAGGGFQAAPHAEALFLYRQTPGSLWQRSLANTDVLTTRMLALRPVERFLRDRAEGLSEAARGALAQRYARWLDLFYKRDRRTFRDIVAWIRGLGFSVPPGTTGTWRFLSHVVGYEKAQAVRFWTERTIH